MKQLFLVLLLAALVYATPSKMWMATYSIENYAGNGGQSQQNLRYTNDQANSFYAQAYKYLRAGYPAKVVNFCW